MTFKDAMGILAILKIAYPNSYKSLSSEEAKTTAGLWREMFADDPVELVNAAVKKYISSDTSGFPPVIGRIRSIMYDMTENSEMTELEAWQLVEQAIDYYDATKNFNALPKILRKLVGTPKQLQTWATMKESDVQTVVSSNFQRSYKAITQREKEQAMLPQALRQRITQFNTLMLNDLERDKRNDTL